MTVDYIYLVDYQHLFSKSEVQHVKTKQLNLPIVIYNCTEPTKELTHANDHFIHSITDVE